MPPAPLLNRPKLRRLDLPYLEAFQACSDSRPPSFSGVAPIPISEVQAYCEMTGVAPASERAKVLRIVQRVDMHYRAQRAEEAEKQAKQRK